MNDIHQYVAAIVLAAGLSSRMGENKLLLPWQNKTIIQQVVDQLAATKLAKLIIVTGRDKTRIEELTRGNSISHVYNENYENGEMLHSIQAGLRQVPGNCDAVLIVLGDQPQIESEVVEIILTTFREKPEYRLIVPSYANRRGHPWLVARTLWDEILSMQSPMTMRDFLKKHQQEIHYLSVNNASVLSDIDTPIDYQKAHPFDDNK